MKTRGKLAAAALFTLQASLGVCAQLVRDPTKVNEIAVIIYDAVMPALCAIYMLFTYVAGGIAMLVVVYAGIKWIGSQDDPGARKQAKTMIYYTIIGLLIIILAVSVISLIVSGSILPCG